MARLQHSGSEDPPQIGILLLGDAEVGKSTFLSRLSLGTRHHPTTESLPLLRDLDQPFPFNISLFNRPYRFEFHDTASPTNYTLLRPAVIILCYDISAPDTLKSVHRRWKYEVETHFNYDETLPVILLGLKRDVRNREDYNGRVRGREGEIVARAAGARSTITDRFGHGNGGIGAVEDKEVLNGRSFVYPQEALRIAQEMRCDRYCECSALTGELCREVFEDIARTAALTTKEGGGKTSGAQCCVM